MDVDDALSFSRKKFAEDKPNIFESASKLTNAGLNKPDLSTKIKLDAFVAVVFFWSKKDVNQISSALKHQHQA